MKRMYLMAAPNLPSPLMAKISRFDEEMKAVLQNNDLDDNTKATAYSQVLSKYLSARNQYAQPTPVPIVETGSATDPSLEAIPKPFMKKAQLLLEQIRKSPNIGWNTRNELLLGGERVQNTNIIDLIDELVRPRSKRNPRGIHEFVQALKENNLPETLINNQDRWGTRERRSPIHTRSHSLERIHPVRTSKQQLPRSRGLKWSKW